MSATTAHIALARLIAHQAVQRHLQQQRQQQSAPQPNRSNHPVQSAPVAR